MAIYLANGSYVDEPCESLSGWSDASVGSGVVSQVVYDTEECFKFYCHNTVTESKALISKDIGSFGTTTILSIKLYTELSHPAENDGGFTLDAICVSGLTFRARFGYYGATELYIHDGDSYVQVGSGLLSLDEWQEFSFEIDCSTPASATCNVYLNHVLVASDIDCSFTLGATPGLVTMTRYGHTRTYTTHVDYLLGGDDWAYVGSKWNSADKAADIVLSGENDLTASLTTGGAHAGVRSIQKLGQGKWYWEVNIDELGPSNLMAVGVSLDSHGLTTRLGSEVGGWGYLPNGKGLHDGVDFTYGDAYGAGDVLGFAADMYQSKLWVSVNGVWQNGGDPVSGTLPIFDEFYDFVFPAWSGYDSADQVTAAFVSAAFTYSIPSGYEQIVLDDSPTAPTGLTEASLVESVSANDVWETYLTYTRSLEEVVGATDTWVVSNPIYSALEEGVGASDKFVVTSPIETLIEESVGASDSFTGYSLSPSISESVQASDVFVGMSLTAIVSELVGALDQWETETLLLIQIESGRHYVKSDVTHTETSYTAPVGQVDIALPFFDVEIFSGGSLDVILPALTVDISGEVGEFGVVDITLPKLETEILGGGYVDINLPSLSADVSGEVEALGSVNIELPALLVDASGKVEGVLTADFTLPALQVNCTGVCEDQISVDISLYPLQVSATGLVGELGTVEIDLPMLDVDITGVPSTDGYVDICLPALLANVHGSAWNLFDDYVLRFVR
jgi:hypothetical protein